MDTYSEEYEKITHDIEKNSASKYITTLYTMSNYLKRDKETKRPRVKHLLTVYFIL